MLPAELGITGTIQRYNRVITCIVLNIEGNDGEQLDQFINFLRLCISQGMMAAMERQRVYEEITYRLRDI